MKKARATLDDMPAEYRREDLGPIVRGKFAKQYAQASNVVVIEDSLTKAFPNSKAVNDALRGLLAVATAATRKAARPRVSAASKPQ